MPGKKCSWRAVVGMRWPEVIYQEVNKSRLTHFNKNTGGERKSGHLQSILRHLFFSLFMFTFFNGAKLSLLHRAMGNALYIFKWTLSTFYHEGEQKIMNPAKLNTSKISPHTRIL